MAPHDDSVRARVACVQDHGNVAGSRRKSLLFFLLCITVVYYSLSNAIGVRNDVCRQRSVCSLTRQRACEQARRSALRSLNKAPAGRGRPGPGRVISGDRRERTPAGALRISGRAGQAAAAARL
jgi:hypothetical protein